jgi:hypothetical protein
MTSMTIKKTIKAVEVCLKKHSPAILTGIGITGMLTTTVMAVSATPRALNLIKKDSQIAHDGDPRAYTKLEAFKSAWKCYIPAAVTGVFSVGCLIAASSESHKRTAAIATAYKISESALTDYKRKVVETIGDKKEQAIRDSLAKESVEKNPVTSSQVIITEKGNMLCLDDISGRYFKSDIDKINRIVNELNRRMMSDMYISLNDFYYELGLSSTSMGDDLGWNISRGYIDLSYSSQLTDDNTPCLVINYRIAPKYNYDSLY